MNAITPWNLRMNCGVSIISSPPLPTPSTSRSSSLVAYRNFSFPFRANPFGKNQNLFILYAKKRKNSKESQPIIKQTLVEEEEEVTMNDEEDEEDFLLDDFQDEDDDDDVVGDDFDEEFMEDEDAEDYLGDGAGGGGIALSGTSWDKEVLALAENVCLSFDGDLNIYAFRTLPNSTIQVRVERMTNKSGSPNMEDIDAFTARYRERLDAAVNAKSIPDNISLEVSSPGVERVVRVPHDLERLKDRHMYVRYVNQVSATGPASELDGVFKLISYDTEEKCCTWGLADVRVNREKAGKGRPLSKKQREWRVVTPFHSLLLVRVYPEM